MAADGSVIIDTKIDTDGIGTGVKKMKKELSGLEKETEKASDSVYDFFSSMVNAEVAANVVTGALEAAGDAIVDFVVDSVGAAADVKAANAQFSQTFKELEKDATKSLESIEKQTGVTATRMQDSYTKIFAFTKSVGADSAEAMGIAERAMLAAADSAAYFDKSLEATTETLMSFIKGNYENDAALGIAATETTRNAEANRLYAKSFQELSESQKVDVLLSMVEAGNQASGALGQAAREADAWSNVTGEATEAWKQLQSVVGDPALEAVTPIIKNITNAISEMVEATEAERIAKDVESFTGAWQSAEKQFEQTSKEIDASSKIAKYYAERLKDIEKAGAGSAESQREYANIVSRLNEIYPDLNLKIDEQTGLLDENSRAMLSNLEAMKEKALFAAYEEHYAEILQSQAEATKAVQEAEYALTGVQGERAGILAQLSEMTGLTADELIRLYNNQTSVNSALQSNSDILPGLAAAISAFASGTGELTAEEMALIQQLIALNAEEATLKDGISEGNAVIADQDKKLEELNKILQGTATSSSDAAEGQGDLTDAVQGTTESVQTLTKEYTLTAEEARKAIDSQLGLFDELKTQSDMSAEGIIKNWANQQQAVDNYNANLQKAADMGLAPKLLQQLSDGSLESMTALEALVSSTDLSVADINAAFEALDTSKATVSKTMEDITADTAEKLDSMAGDVEESWDELTGVVKTETEEMQGYIDGLHGKTVYVDVITRNKSSASPGSGGASNNTTVSPYALNAAAIETASLPHLASGAVIPPNSHFVAVLGDQRRGTNIEAPLATIQEAVRSEIGGMMSGFQAVVEEVAALRETVEGIEIGDTVIGEAVTRYQQYMNIIRGGTT